MNSKTPTSPAISRTATVPWVIVSSGFHFVAGQAKAVAGLADYLIRSGTPVYLVGNSFDPVFLGRRGVTVYRARSVHGVDVAGNVFLSHKGEDVVRRILRQQPDSRIVVNGGNCLWGDINWVHYLHHAWIPNLASAPFWFRLKERVIGGWDRQRERRAIGSARLVITNSHRTTDDVVRLLEVPADRVRTVYYGADASWAPPTEDERRRGRQLFALHPERPLVVFVAGFGYDNRKGFDTLLAAWRLVCQSPDWDANLVLAGGGKASTDVASWIAREGLSDRVQMIGFTNRVFDLLAAADLLVSPVRYEPYGLNVQEALCRGVPAIVSTVAGVAEEYSPELASMLLQDPNDPNELADRLRHWRADVSGWCQRFRPLSDRLRSRTWDDMALEIVAEATVV